MNNAHQKKITPQDWKKILGGFFTGFGIYFTLTLISYRSYDCASGNTLTSFECWTIIPSYVRIYIVLFSFVFGIFIQEIDEPRQLVGYNILGTGSAMILFFLYIQIITDRLIFSEIPLYIMFNFGLIFISSLFGQGLSTVAYPSFKKRNESSDPT